jgi:host factor-I protein
MVFNNTSDNIYDDVISEEIFLDSMINRNVNVFLIGGVKLTGEIAGHDTYSIILEKEGVRQLVYKSAIATISPENKQRRRIV